MSDWGIYYSYKGDLVSLAVDSRNVTGEALLSAEAIAAQLQAATFSPPGVFRFTLTDTDAVTVSVEHYGDAASPALFSGERAVIADGATENYNLIPGIAVVISGSSVEGDIFEIGVGCYWDSDVGEWQRFSPFDIAFIGVDSAERVFSVKNESGSVQCQSQLVAVNAMRIVNTQTTSRPFYAFRQTGIIGPTAHEDLLGAAVTFTNLIAGTPNIVSVLIDGEAIDVYDVTNDTLIAGGIGLNCDGTTVYRFADTTAYASGEFVLSASLAVTDTATVYVSDGGDFVQIATSSGELGDGASAIDLTGLDAPDGVVAVNESVQIRVLISAPEAKTAAMNQRLFALLVSSTGV